MADTKVIKTEDKKYVPKKETQAYAIAALGQGLVTVVCQVT